MAISGFLDRFVSKEEWFRRAFSEKNREFTENHAPGNRLPVLYKIWHQATDKATLLSAAKYELLHPVRNDPIRSVADLLRKISNAIKRIWNTTFLFKDPLELWRERTRYSFEVLTRTKKEIEKRSKPAEQPIAPAVQEISVEQSKSESISKEETVFYDLQKDEREASFDEREASFAEFHDCRSDEPLVKKEVSETLPQIPVLSQDPVPALKVETQKPLALEIARPMMPAMIDPIAPLDPVIAPQEAPNILIETLKKNQMPNPKERATLSLIFDKFFGGAVITPTNKENEFLVQFERSRKGQIDKVIQTGDVRTAGESKFDQAKLERAKEFICKIDPALRKIEFVQYGNTAPIVVKSYINVPIHEDIQFTIKSFQFTPESYITISTQDLTFTPPLSWAFRWLAQRESVTLDRGSPHDRFQNSFSPLQWEV